MKRQTKQIQTLGDGRMLQVMRFSLLTVLALFISSGLAQSFYGFASYQDYLNNYYGQSAYQTPTTIRAVTYTPYTAPTYTAQTTITNTANPYNGFASYQAYLDNFYAGQNVTSPAVDPCGFAQTMSIFVSANNDCAPVNNTARSSSTNTVTNTVTNTAAFNGYPSYQAYLNAFYAGQTSQTQTTARQQTTPAVNTSVTSGYYGYNSYQDYLQAFYALNSSSATTSRTSAPAPTPAQPSTNVSGYFDFVIGQAYQFSNGLILTVETLNDSRCPQGAQCVWQGDIAATVRLEKDTDDRRVNVNLIEGQQAPQIVVDNASVQFVGLGENVNNANTLQAYVILN